MSLKSEIDDRRKKIHTDGYPVSIGELMSLYKEDELDIHPEFQRFFRWNLGQKSKLIESLLLGIPIPSIFVFQRDDGVWDVIDGLQRLSTIFEFVGILRDVDGALIPPITLTATKYLPSLDGVCWEHEDEDVPQFETEQQLLIKRSKIDTKIILRESDREAKFELFERLNTGGSTLTDQELRNCILVMKNAPLYAWLRDLANDENFQQCTSLSDKSIDEQYDMELVVRFIVLRSADLETVRGINDLGAFLTEGISEIADDRSFDRAPVEAAFRWTFQVLASQLQESAFKRFDTDASRFKGGFLVSAFEVIALGLGHNADAHIAASSTPLAESIAQNLWSDQDFRKHIGSGIRAGHRLPHTLPKGRSLFRP